MSFILNFQSPVELDDLIDRYRRDGLTNIDHILSFESTMKEWTVDKEAKIGDTVFFMCAKTSKDHMGHVCVEAREYGVPEIIAYAEAERALYKKYAGKIVAIGQVGSEPFVEDDSGYAKPHWRSPWYAKISNFQLLGEPVGIDCFRDFIKVSRTGSVTRLDEEQDERLVALVATANPSVRLMDVGIS